MKSILIDLSLWQWLSNLKTQYNFRSIGDVLTIIKIHTDEAIKRGDLEFVKQDDK